METEEIFGMKFICHEMENFCVGNTVEFTVINMKTKESKIINRKIYDSKDGMNFRFQGLIIYYEDFN